MRRLPGLDYGRAVFIIAVVGWHTQALGRSRVLEADAAGTAFPVDVVSVLYFNALLLAVPFFLTTSLLLYARARGDGARFAPRARRLAWLAAFWISVWALTRGVGPVDAGAAPAYVLSGGRSVFYFLVELLQLTAVLELGLRAGLRHRPRVTAALVLLGVALPLVRVPLADALPGEDVFLAYWSPLNFAVYPFVALAILQLGALRVRVVGMAAAAVAYVGLAVVEWGTLTGGAAYGVDGTVVPPYGRPSLVLAAGVITLALVRLRGTTPRPVRLASDLSLGVYCVHPFLVTNGPAVFGTAWATIAPRSWLLFLVVLALSVALAYPLRRGLVT